MNPKIAIAAADLPASAPVRRGLAVAWLALLVLGACGRTSDTPRGGARSEISYSAVAARPTPIEAPGTFDAPLPGDVPGFPGAAFYMGGTSQTDLRFVSLRTAASNAEVYTYYRGALWSLGWEIDREAKEGRSFVLVARKDGRVLSVRFETVREGSEIALETSSETLRAGS